VAFRVVARATHTGEFMGIPASGKQITVPMIGIARVTDGQVTQLWNSPDQLGLLQQIGALPEPR
jgi:predicted ester cyclase